MLRICSALVLLLATSVLPLPAVALQTSSEPRAVDGDTIAIGKDRFRIWGIDAPEKAQNCTRDGKDWACGEWSKQMLAADMAKGRVACEAVDRDRYNRIVALCRVDGVDLAEAQIKRGAAVAYSQYTKRYVPFEQKAKAARKGVWGAEMVNPSDYRRGKTATKAPAAAAAPASATPVAAAKGCAIKGNINAKGVKIYHRPDQRDYAKTQITPATGEQMFCTEAEAKAAGFRAALN